MYKYILFLPFFMLASCAVLYDANLDDGSSAVPKILSEKIPDTPDMQPDVQVYKLSTGDVVAIKVYMESSMDRELRIGGDGRITYPMAGNVKIAGLTVTEAENKIAELLADYIRNPQVSIVVKQYNSKKVSIFGQVHKPSALQLPSENKMTLMEAITSAGGFTTIANKSKIRVVRTENGAQRVLEVDVTKITNQGNREMDIVLMPGDVIYVPETIF